MPVQEVCVVSDSKVVELLLERALRAQGHRPERAEETYAEIVGRGDASARQMAIALLNAGVLRGRAEDAARAIRLWGRVEALRGVPVYLSCQAWMNRGKVRYRLGDAVGAVCDYTAVVTHAAILETHQEAVADARVYVPAESSPLEMVGRARGYLGEDEGALADLRAVQATAGMSAEGVARSWARLVEVHLWAGRYGEVPEAVRWARWTARWPEDLRVLAGFARLAEGRVAEAIYECEHGLPWVHSTRRLDYLEAHFDGLLRRHGVKEGAEELHDRLCWRREELERYAPMRESETDW
jgi:hypothetical protein